MTMNLIAILVSLAMMLTGAGGEGQPAEASRTLLLRDISVAINGRQVDFEPVLRVGASTDGEKALFDFGIDSEGGALLPIQVGVDPQGVTALFEKSDTAVTVTAHALEALMESIPTDALAGTGAETGDSELMSFMTNQYIPAYVGMLTAIQDEDFLAEVQATTQPIVDGMLERGEGTPVTEEVDGEARELTEYTYAVESDQLARLSDAILTSNDVFKAYYDAMFGMFALMPEESGMSGITSYADMFEKTGMNMRMDIVEKRSDDGSIVLSDAVLTMDMSEMVARMAEGQEGEAPKMEPLVMNIHSTQVGKSTVGTVDMTFTADDVKMDMSARTTADERSMMLDMVMDLYEDGDSVGSVRVDIGKGTAGAKGSTFKHANFDIDLGEAGGSKMSFTGNADPDGTAEGDFELSVSMGGTSVDLSFVAEITTDAVEDRVSGHEAALVIDDLSEEGLSGLTEDQDTAMKLVGISGSLIADAQKLMANESVQALSAMLTEAEDAPVEGAGEPVTDVETAENAEGEAEPQGEIVIDDSEADTVHTGGQEIEPGEAGEDGEYEIDLSDIQFEDGGEPGFDIGDLEGFEEVEDDGVLGFEVPELTWLPDGWAVDTTNEDTAYDWAEANVKDGNGQDTLYVVFFSDVDDNQKNYIVSDSGAVKPVEGREIGIVDFGEGGLSVTLREKEVYVNLLFYSNAIDVDTVGKIVAGLRF